MAYDGGVTIEKIRLYAPALAEAIESAESQADNQSKIWMDGGPGGVQRLLDAWVSKWLEAIEQVRASA